MLAVSDTGRGRDGATNQNSYTKLVEQKHMPTRRETVIGSVAAATVALAGCVDSLPGGGGSDEPSGGGGTDEPVAADWIADWVSGDRLSVRVQRPSQLAAVDELDYNGNPFAPTIGDGDIDLQVNLFGGFEGDAFVFIGSFDNESILDVLDESSPSEGQLEKDGTYSGYDMYSPADESGSSIVGVNDGTVIIANRTRGESIIDASQDDGARLVDTDSQFGQLYEGFEGEDLYQLQRFEAESDVVVGTAATFDGDETELRLVVDHPDAESVEEFGEDTATALSEQGLTDVAIETDGTRLRVTGTRQTSSLSSPGAFDNQLPAQFTPVLRRYTEDPPQEQPVAPQVSFDYDYDEEAQTLTVTVMSGDTFTAGQVTVEGSGFDAVGAPWADLAGVAPSSTVSAADRIQLQKVAPDVELDLVWTAADGNESAIIGTFAGPDA